MTASKRVLIVEDDAHIAELLILHLRDEGYTVEHAANGDDGLRLLEEQSWDALVLDLMLPGTNGLEICRRTRAMAHYTPTIITSARGSEVHRVLGLEVGADDYLAKPFSVVELVARLRALLRRVDALARASAEGAGAVRASGLAIFPLEREAQLDGRRLDLTPREFDLLYFFAANPGKVFSRSELLDRVWGYRHSGYEHTVNTHINRVRAKIEADPTNPRRILTVWGRGYKLASGDREP
jgi:two-component system, OmpR family, response regulator